MKRSTHLSFILAVIMMAFVPVHTGAQQYKLKQSTGISGMKSESTVYVKGMRKRTESAGFMGIGASTHIEQCDLQRTVYLNDKKKLYFIEPFAKDEEEVIDDDAKAAPPKNKPTPPTTTKTGGTITMWYSITDTGERKKMFGLTARHVWTYQKMKPSADACMMKDSMIIKTDGWYIDLPQFNCPERRTKMGATPQQSYKPDCRDRFVTHRSGKGKLGFPLTETTTIIMGNGNSKMGNIETNTETIELSTEKLDSMLFEIPPGYTETTNREDLQDKMDAKDMIKQFSAMDKNAMTVPKEEKRAGILRIGVYQPAGEGELQFGNLQQYITGLVHGDKWEAMSVASDADARKYNCDLVLHTQFTKVKQASKVGGLLKAIKNTDPGASSSTNIEATLTLTSLADGSTKTEQHVSGKYDGKPDDAAMRAMEEGCRLVNKSLK